MDTKLRIINRSGRKRDWIPTSLQVRKRDISVLLSSTWKTGFIPKVRKDYYLFIYIFIHPRCLRIKKSRTTKMFENVSSYNYLYPKIAFQIHFPNFSLTSPIFSSNLWLWCSFEYASAIWGGERCEAERIAKIGIGNLVFCSIFYIDIFFGSLPLIPLLHVNLMPSYFHLYLCS